MSQAGNPEIGATILPLRAKQAAQTVAMARTLELYSKSFPTRQRLMMLLETWLFAAERDGVSERQPDYADALKRAINTLETSPSVADAIARLRSQEAGVCGSSPQGRRLSVVSYR
jgi:hypothetical protein